MTHLSLGENNFGGTLPDTISNLSTNILILNFKGNKIVGSIPTGIGNLINLQALNLLTNHFTSNIPADLGKLERLQLLILSGNNLYGEIPLTFGNLTLLTDLSISHNRLHGSIPSSLGKCKMLEKLILDQNNLTGTIPREVMSLSSLLYINISQNKLTGSLPVEVGNLKNIEELDVSENMLVGNVPSDLGSCVKLRLLYLEGNKFWGILPSSLSNLKVKVLNLHFRGAAKSFIAECKALKSIKHRNLVKVLTACSSIDFHGNDFKALVYEFMVNGSLEEWLHQNGNKDDGRDFGLARFLPEEHWQSSSIGIRGSIGYAAPGVNVADPTLFQQSKNGEASSGIDNTTNQNSIEGQRIEDCLISILKVGITYSEELLRDRPAMNEVVGQLHVINNALLGGITAL
ncbi:leucine-rich repeat protein kinase family protein [Actinidia rufa]|uniref:Leucine-rich repeat protein kinase family protein n=1 Tax=Actinidia rufa TaxID=165716 RepID=A0A7J0DTG3_9ERIC|nr:leucine-rich repeat protein kinase family protein [Actinidia rufa]